MINFICLISYLSTFTFQTVVDGLTSGNFRIFAVGGVSSKLTLFISSSNDKTDFNNGYQVVQKIEPTDGIFTVENAVKLSSKYTSIVGTDVMFICNELTGDNLITMNLDGVGAFNLGLNKFTKLNVTQYQPIVCYSSGSLHLSTSELKFYFLVDKSSGSVAKFHFDSETIISALGCSPKQNVGTLCISGTRISISTICSGSPPANIISGYIGKDIAYLFDSSNTVFYFDSTIFKGGSQSVKLNIVNKSQAWLGQFSTEFPQGKLKCSQRVNFK